VVTKSTSAGSSRSSVSDASIMRKLLTGAIPVCLDCGRELSPKDAKVTVRSENAKAPLWRCGDCEYRRVMGR